LNTDLAREVRFSLSCGLSQRMEGFRKTEDCPSSEKLLTFQSGGVDLATYGDVCRHLVSCDFCAAEVEMYGLYPPGEEKVTVDQIPEPLYELAEALLHRRRDLAPLYKLVKDDD